MFNFSVERENNKPVLYIYNAAERLLVDSIRQSADWVFIQMPFFNSRFKLVIKNNHQLEGGYVKTNGAKQLQILFTAIRGFNYRYAAMASPLYDITGQ